VTANDSVQTSNLFVFPLISLGKVETNLFSLKVLLGNSITLPSSRDNGYGQQHQQYQYGGETKEQAAYQQQSGGYGQQQQQYQQQQQQQPYDSGTTESKYSGAYDEQQNQNNGDYQPDSKDVEDIFSYARHSRLEEVENLLDRGVPVNVRDQFGNTILNISCQNGHKRIMKCALRRGADMNVQNYRGNSPLHFCFKYGFGATLGAYLIGKGADVSIRNTDGQTCTEYR
jgi:hypothetical protein